MYYRQCKIPLVFRISVFRVSLARAVVVVALRILSAMWTVAFILSTSAGSWILDLASRRLIADGRGSGRGPSDYGRAALVDDRTRPTGQRGRSLTVTSLIIMRKERPGCCGYWGHVIIISYAQSMPPRSPPPRRRIACHRVTRPNGRNERQCGRRVALKYFHLDRGYV